MKKSFPVHDKQETDAAIGTEPILQFFGWTHLPEALQETSRPFGELAFNVVLNVPRSPERTVTLRKLLEAKDAAVRATLFKS